MATLNINLSTEQFLTLFQQFTKKEQVKIVENIQNLVQSKSKNGSTPSNLEDDNDFEIPQLIQQSQSFAFLNDEIEDVYSDENLKVRY